VGSVTFAYDELGEYAIAPGNLVAFQRPAVSRVPFFFAVDHATAIC